MTGYDLILDQMHADRMLLRQMAAHLELARVADEHLVKARLHFHLRRVLRQRLHRLKNDQT